MILGRLISVPDVLLTAPLGSDTPFLGGLHIVAPLRPGAYAPASPVYSGASYAGIEVRTCFHDWFQHIHYIDAKFELGSISGETSRAFKIWNAYLTPQTLSSITGMPSGLTITPSPPVGFAAIEHRGFTLTIAAQGDPQFSVVITFNWQSAPSFSVTVSGIRVIAMPWCQRAPMLETLRWKTEAYTTRSGKEQRMSLRTTPVQTYDATIDVADFSGIQHTLRSWYGRAFALPMMGEAVQATVTAGATEILCDTTKGDWREFAMLRKSDSEFQIIGITSVLPDRLVLAQPIALSYIGHVFPAATAFMQSDPVRITYGFRGEAQVSLRFTNPRDLAGSTQVQYKGYDVLLQTPMQNPVDDTIVRRIEIMDNGIGTPWLDILWDKSKVTRPMRWLVTKDELWPLRQWLHARKGQCNPFWHPSFEPDFIASGSGQIGSSLVVKRNGFVEHRQNNDIAIETTAGWRFAGIGSVSDNGNGTMTIGLDVSLTDDYSAIKRICLLGFKRLADDEVQINWIGASRAEVLANFIEMP